MKNKIFLIFFHVIITFSLFSDNDEPSWVYLMRSENLKEKGEYAKAIIEAKKSRIKYIDERLEEYYINIREKYRDKIDYELKQMKDNMREELLQNDEYPGYHEIMGDLYVLTDFLNEAEKEYKIALSQKKFFEYPQKNIEIQYKIADIYNKRNDYELEDIIYREITSLYFNENNNDFWNRIKINIFGRNDENFKIKGDLSLNHVFRIYRIDGIEYLNALYKIGRRSVILERHNEGIFYLVNAAIVWMTYYSNQIKKINYDFQFEGPADFINYITKNRIYEYDTENYIFDEILFLLGYSFYKQEYLSLADNYFNLAIIFSKGTKREEDIKNRIEYIKLDKNYIFNFKEFNN